MSEHLDVIETSEDGRYRVVLMPDMHCESPMDAGDCWVTSVIARNGYGLEWAAMRDPGGRFNALTHFQAELWRTTDTEPVEAFKRWMRLFHGIEVHEVVIHNGYRDTSSALAWIEPSELVRVGFDDVIAPRDSAPEPLTLIDAEVEEYNRWADGETYGYAVQELVTWEAQGSWAGIDRETWEDTDDSCWGFIGYEYAEQEAREALAEVTR